MKSKNNLLQPADEVKSSIIGKNVVRKSFSVAE